MREKTAQGAVDLTVGSPAKRILYFSLPLLIGNVFQLLYSWMDAIILGKISGDMDAFAALSAAIPVINLLLTVVTGFMAGAAVVIGQYFGNKKNNELKRCYTTLLISLIVLSAFFMAAGFFLSTPLLKLIRVDESLLSAATEYLKIYFFGIIFMVTYNVFSQSLRSLGNSLVPFIVLIFCSLLNTAFDMTSVIVFDMGITGVAVGTLVGQGASAIILFIYIQARVPLLRLRLVDIRFSFSMLRRTLKIAMPSMLQNIFACAGFMIIHAIVNSKGVNFTTAFGLGARIDELLSQVTQSFGVAITSFAAQNKGKGEINRISKGFSATILISFMFVAFMCIVILPFKTHIINLFIRIEESGTTGNISISEVIRITKGMLNIYVPSFFLLTIMTVSSGLLRGTGKASTSMSINLFSFIVRMVAAFSLLSIEMGVIYASPIGWGAGALWGLGAYLIGGWKINKVDAASDNDPNNFVSNIASAETVGVPVLDATQVQHNAATEIV